MLLVVLYLISYRSLGLLLLFARLLSVGVQSWSLYLDGELEAWPPVECAVQEKVLVPPSSCSEYVGGGTTPSEVCHVHSRGCAVGPFICTKCFLCSFANIMSFLQLRRDEIPLLFLFFFS